MQQTVNRKLRSILSSQQFCGLCLESTNCAWSADVVFEIIVHEKLHRKPFVDIISDIFGHVTYLPASRNICKQCTDKTLELYVFVQNIMETAKILDRYVNSLYSKIVSIDEKLDPIQYDNEDKKCTIVLRSRYQSKNEKKIEDNRVRGINKILTSTDDLPDEVTISTVLAKDSIKSKEVSENSKKNCETVDYNFKSSVKDESLAKDITKNYEKEDSNFDYSELEDRIESFAKKKLKRMEKNKIRRLNKVTKKVGKRKLTKTENKKYECVDCKLVKSSCKEWMEHCQTKHIEDISVDKTSKPRCEACLKTFSSSKYLLRHYKLHNKVKCKYCATILEHSELQNHFKANHQDFILTVSDKEVLEDQHFNEGVNDCNGNQCEKCLKHFNNEQFKDHFCRFKCLCPEVQCLHEKYLNSYRDQVSMDAEIIKCPDCEYTCNKNKVDLIDHANKEHLNHRPYICSICAEKFFSSKDYAKHKTSHNTETKYICKECNIEFDERKKLAWHNRKHKRAKQDKVKCTICSKEMFESTLNMHMKIHEGIESHSFTCETCGKSFAFKVRLDQHKMTHSDPIPCNLCGQLIKPMSMYLHLRRHKIRLNPALKPKPAKKLHNKKCEYCDYTTYCKDLLEIHINKEHLKVKPHVCNICGASYMSKYYLNQHMKVHTEEKKYNCSVCNKSLRHKIGLKKHMMLHTGEQPHICEVCGEGYKTVTMLKYHMQKHSGKNEQCPLCGGMYYSIKHVRSHIKKCHWEFKDRKFDYKQVRGLTKEHYHIFQDRRKAIADDIYDNE